MSIKSNNILAPSELILNPDGSVYHLNLLPEDIATTIITVGDPDRAKIVASYFEEIEVEKQKREFATYTGRFKGKRLTVISTGIGTDNIDIVFNELDALVNIDLKSRKIRSKHTALNFIRIGTSGSMQLDVPVDSYLVSAYAMGFDSLLHFYERSISEENKKFEKKISNLVPNIIPYWTKASDELVATIGEGFKQGTTATCTGFYAPQGRALRLKAKNSQILDQLQQVTHSIYRFTNFEMETAGIYGLASLLGHRAISLNAILANRVEGTFSETPKETVKKLIEITLERILKLNIQ